MSGKRALVAPAQKPQTATVIMAHGLGDSGAGWISLAENWRRRGKFEHNGGFPMPGWYDITSFSDLDQRHDEPGILRSRAALTAFITEEIEAGIPSNRLVLGGFSQGGAMSIFTGVTTPHKLAGVFGLSCYLVMSDKVKQMAKDENKDANKDTPFFMGHGDSDEVVKPQWGAQTAEFLKKDLGHSVEFKTYKHLPHSASPEEVDDLEKFIQRCLPEQK